ncbi:TolC family protein [Chitinophaga rhizosphaerae]|uniref:TolC family protein n=1 Tax=Chitinophaga rhizosphaerae TaxID=1864947 RepID=UPI000F810F33|nr:TolC family protein [Chitinophaga rhizosphaerae]
MKKQAFILSFLLISALPSIAQTNPQQAPKSQQAIKDKLVELALNNPAIRIRTAERDKSVSELAKANGNWLNYVTASMNLNEITLRMRDLGGNQNGTQLYYPLWNVGINVPLGSFIGKANDVKIARRNIDIATEQQEVAKRQITALVLTKYQDYITTKQQLSIQQELNDEDQAAFDQAEAKFATGGVTYEQYSAISKKYNDGRVRKLNLERDLIVVGLELEEIIGQKLETVVGK